MFMKYMRRLNTRDCPVVISLKETIVDTKSEARIQRNSTSPTSQESNPSDIYIRAREIYYRARRTRPVRAASIF
jgi:hypothetical protein